MEFTGERFVPAGLNMDEISIEHLQRYHSIKKLVQNKIVLDAASGEGYGSYVLANDAKQVFGIDISREAIIHAKNRYQKENLQYIEKSIEQLPFNNKSIDVVVSFETIEHVDENLQRKFIQEVSRVLRKDGILVISTPDKYIYSDKPKYKNQFHVKEFYEHEFYDFLNTHFKNVKFFYQKFRVSSVLTNSTSNNLNVVNISEEKGKLDGKYIIAVCSNEQIDQIDISSALIDYNDKLEDYINRILSLQNEVKEKNGHIDNLLSEIRDKDSLIIKHNLRIEELSQWGLGLDKEIKLKDGIINDKTTRIGNLIQWGKDLDKESKLKDDLIDRQNKRLDNLIQWGKGLEKSVFEKDKRLNELIDECIQLKQDLQAKKQLLLEKINKIEELEAKVRENQEDINSKKQAIDDFEIRITDLIEGNQNLYQKVREMEDIKMDYKNIEEELNKFKNELSNKTKIVENLTAHIDQLLEKERILNNILKSDGWKVLNKYYKVRDLILPAQSKRKLFAKLTFRLLKNPRLYLQSISKEKLKKFWYYLKTEDVTRVNDRIDNYIDKYTEQAPDKIEVLTPEFEEKEKIVFKNYDKPLVSIIIPVYNQWEYTYSCLKAIYETTKNIEYEVIIADDVSTDETVNIQNYIENIRVIRNKENKGFLLNCNNAAKYSKGKYIHFLNNDTNVQKGWLSSLVELAENDETIGLVGSKLVYKDGRLQEAGGIIWQDASGWNYGRLDDPNKAEYNYVKETDYISGASIMVRKDLWEKIGGFDERYVPAYYEDTDLAFEIRKLGFKVVYQPHSVVVHFEGVSHGTNISNGIKKYQVENKEKFTNKWQEILKKHFENGKDVFKARDKSKEKKTVLVIDHYVPHYDKDAGSRCTYSYLKLFIQMGYKVIFIGDNFYKHEPYTSQLQQLGIEVLYGNWYAQNIWKWIDKNGKYFDYVYLNRPHISIKYIDKLKQYTSAKIVYFGHDLHYLRELRNYEIEKNKELLKSSNDWKKVEFELIEKSDVVYVVRSFEEEMLKKEFPDKIIRTIPVYIYDKISIQESNFEKRKDLLFVGGFAHKPNIDAVEWFVENIFPNIIKQLKDIKLYIVGSKPPEKIKNLASNNIIVTGFVTDDELQNLYNQCRIVVVPLRFGAGVKGKVVEALYYQVPIITTSIGAEGLPNTQDHLAIEDKSEDFARQTIDLYKDKDTWTKLSQSSYEYVINNFSTKAAFNIVSKDFR